MTFEASFRLTTRGHDDTRGAEAKLRKFLKQGAEILCVAALADVQASLSLAFSWRRRLRVGLFVDHFALESSVF